METRDQTNLVYQSISNAHVANSTHASAQVVVTMQSKVPSTAELADAYKILFTRLEEKEGIVRVVDLPCYMPQLEPFYYNNGTRTLC